MKYFELILLILITNANGMFFPICDEVEEDDRLNLPPSYVSRGMIDEGFTTTQSKFLTTIRLFVFYDLGWERDCCSQVKSYFNEF